MPTIRSNLCLVLAAALLCQSTMGYMVLPSTQPTAAPTMARHPAHAVQEDKVAPSSLLHRRGVLGSLCTIATVLGPSARSYAVYNSESTRPGAIVELNWKDRAVGGFPIAIDGINADPSVPGTDVTLRYELPAQWKLGERGRDDNRHYTTKRGIPCCRRITLYQKTGESTVDSLDKAIAHGTGVRVARALDIGERSGKDLIGIKQSSLLRSKKMCSEKNGQCYFMFDLALYSSHGDDDSSQPESSSTLDTVFLVSATVMDKRLYACVVQCNPDQWFAFEKDLTSVRSSFEVHPFDSLA